MPRPKQHKVILKEAVKTAAEGAFEKRIEFGDEEYVVLQSPWSRPSEYLEAKNREFAALEYPPDDEDEETRKKREEAKIEFLRRDALDRLFHCIADWNLTVPDAADPRRAVKVPVPTLDDPSGWNMLDDDVQKFLDVLIGEMWYREGRSADQAQAVVQELAGTSDPNGSEPVELPISNGLSKVS